MGGRAVAVLAVTVVAAELAAPVVIAWPRGADAAVTIMGQALARPTSTGRSSPTATTVDTGTATAAVPIEDPPATSTRATTVPPSTVATHSASVAPLTPGAVMRPAHVDIDGTEIGADVIPAAIDGATGELAIPDDPAVVGWYQYGPSPGESGSAVLAGHLDWHHRPGAFYRLAGVPSGAVVTIRYADGSARRFQVIENTLVPKPSLPVSDVFVRTGPPTLRLITCGGTFDRATHHYRSNVVVTAVPLD